MTPVPLTSHLGLNFKWSKNLHSIHREKKMTSTENKSRELVLDPPPVLPTCWAGSVMDRRVQGLSFHIPPVSPGQSGRSGSHPSPHHLLSVLGFGTWNKYFLNKFPPINPPARAAKKSSSLFFFYLDTL